MNKPQSFRFGREDGWEGGWGELWSKGNCQRRGLSVVKEHAGARAACGAVDVGHFYTLKNSVSENQNQKSSSRQCSHLKDSCNCVSLAN